MIKVEASTTEIVNGDKVSGQVTSHLTFEDIKSEEQFQSECEAVLWNTLNFMEQNSELTLGEILRSLLSDLEDNGGKSPYEVVQEVEDEAGE